MISQQKFYITTPIYYVNDKPHIGHAYTTIAADVIARYYRLLEYSVFFLTGTDEHGAKVVQSAKTRGKSPKIYASEIAKEFINIWKKLNISNDFFIRTTDSRHEEKVKEVLQKIYSKGYIYEGVYKGSYCIGCEKYLTKDEIVNNHCLLHPNQKIIYQKEKNYFFKLSRFENQLLSIYLNSQNKNHLAILPKDKAKEIVGKLKEGLNDIPISREHIDWGIKLPWDSSQSCYVWVDALFNYWTATRFIKHKNEFWPPNLQLIGKDILWFHAVIWPALLLAADLSLPKKIFAHGFFTINGKKMSKSVGNTITPQKLIRVFGVDATRYLLLSGFSFGSDGDVSISAFNLNYNAQLANGLGNLTSRIIKLINDIDFKPPYSILEGNISSLMKDDRFKFYHRSMTNLEFDKTIKFIQEKIREIDKVLDKEKPWRLKKTNSTLFKKVLNELLLSLFEISLLIEPFMPQTSHKIKNALLEPKRLSGTKLFPRI